MPNTYIGLKANGMNFDAHLTVMYLGRKLDRDKIAYAQEVTAFLRPVHEYVVERKNIETFSNNTPVVTVVAPTMLFDLRRRLEEDYGFISPSQFDFNPHISLKLNGDDIIIPKYIRLDRLGLY